MVARGFEYGDIFMGKVMEWLKNNWLVAIIIFVLSVVAGAILVVLILGWCDIISFEGQTSAGDLLRTFILCIGAIGGVYGLHLATKRQKTFSDQVQVQVDQSFNDRLGRGTELLTNKNVVMRCAGLQVLQDLMDNANDKQKAIVSRIIYDFFCDKAKLKYHKNGNHCARSRKNTTQDLQDALDILINFPLFLRQDLSEIYEHKLDFRSIDFSHLALMCKRLEMFKFIDSCFFRTKFHIDEIVNVDFTRTNFGRVGFDRVSFSYVNFCDIKFDGVRFREIDLRYTYFMTIEFTTINFSKCCFIDVAFDDAELEEVTFDEAYFIGGKFQIRNPIKISSYSDLPNFIGTKIESTEFNFSTGMNPKDYFELCYSPKGQQPSQPSIIDDSRIYERGAHGFDVFVQPETKEDWSGQLVSEWVAMEIAQWKLEHIEYLSPSGLAKTDTSEAIIELENATKTLHNFQEKLGLPQKIPQPKSTDAT